MPRSRSGWPVRPSRHRLRGRTGTRKRQRVRGFGSSTPPVARPRAWPPPYPSPASQGGNSRTPAPPYKAMGLMNSLRTLKGTPTLITAIAGREITNSLRALQGDGTHEFPPLSALFADGGRGGVGFGFAGLSEAAGAALRPCLKLAVRGGFWAVATSFGLSLVAVAYKPPSRRGRRQPTGEISRPTLDRRWGAGRARRRERPALPSEGPRLPYSLMLVKNFSCEKSHRLSPPPIVKAACRILVQCQIRSSR
jgi:hypothetical protein